MKERTSDRAYWIGLGFCAVVIVIMLAFLTGARAQEIANGVLCDEKAQIERYLALPTERRGTPGDG